MMKKNDNVEIYKEKVSIQEPTEKNIYEQEAELNQYFLKVSYRYRLAKIFTVALLCVFILSSLFIYGDKFTYENARYVLRDLGQILSEDSLVPSEKIVIDPDGDMDYGIFRKNIVIAGESKTKIISVTGKEKLVDHTKYTSPTIVSSDKYCIVYSLGAYNLSVYNTVARVYDMKFDTPIYDVAVSDNGYIAVMTESREYRCVVYLYNSDFNLVSTYKKTKYPSSVVLSNDGSRVYISTFGSVDGDYFSELAAYDKKNEKPIYQFNHSQSLPLDTKIFSNENTALIFNDRVVIVDKQGNKLNEKIFLAGISNCSFDNDVLTVMDQEKQSNVVSFDSNGNVILSQTHSDTIGVCGINNGVLIQKKNVLICTNDNYSKSIEISSVPRKIIFSDGYVFVCHAENVCSYKT